MINDCFKQAPYLYETLSDKSVTLAPSVFERLHGQTFFDFLESEKGREKALMFGKAMIGFGDINGKTILTEVYPWSSLPKSTTFKICDIGGGTGHVVMALLKAFPEHLFKAVIQDLPKMLAQGTKLWEKEFPEAVEQERVEFVPIDFLNEAPVAGCDFYYLRLCLHNWPDAQALDILSNIVKAMRAKSLTSRFLLHDFVLGRATPVANNSARTPSYEGLDIAPPPLLENYGAGSSIGYDMDINMMGLLAAKERTFDELLLLSSQAGLSFERFWDAGVVDILEFSLSQGIEVAEKT